MNDLFLVYRNQNFIKLKAGAWYDSEGRAGTNDKVFTTIIDFKKRTTFVKGQISASGLGLSDFTIDEAKNKIQEKFIFDHRDIIFIGDINLTNHNYLVVNKCTINEDNNSVEVTFMMFPGTWYNWNGDLGTNSMFCNFSIIF